MRSSKIYPLVMPSLIAISSLLGCTLNNVSIADEANSVTSFDAGSLPDAEPDEVIEIDPEPLPVVIVPPTPAADVTPPVISGMSPADGSQPPRAFTVSAAVSDNVGVASCVLLIDGTSHPAKLAVARAQASIASYDVSGMLGNRTLQFRCLDIAGNQTLGAPTTVHVVDGAAPGVGTAFFSSSQPVPGTVITVYADYVDDLAIVACVLESSFDATATKWLAAAMTLEGNPGGTAKYLLTVTSAGTLHMRARCSDNLGNETTGPAATVVIGTADTQIPTVGRLTASGPFIAGSTVTASATVADNAGVTNCKIESFSLTGSWNTEATANVTSVTQGLVGIPLVISSSDSLNGVKQYRFSCTDAAGNVGLGATADLVITGQPVISAVTATSKVKVGMPATFSATFSDVQGVVSCQASIRVSATAFDVVNGAFSGQSTAGTAAFSLTILNSHIGSDGTASVALHCVDTDGNAGMGRWSSITVAP